MALYGFKRRRGTYVAHVMRGKKTWCDRYVRVVAEDRCGSPLCRGCRRVIQRGADELNDLLDELDGVVREEEDEY